MTEVYGVRRCAVGGVFRTVHLTYVSGCRRMWSGFAEREAEKQRLLSHSSELNFEKEALEQRASDLSAALVVGITTTHY